MNGTEWLQAYGRAWEAKDAAGFVALFSEDARYYWTPFSDALMGREQIAAEFLAAASNQENIRFSFEVLAEEEAYLVAHWHTELERPAGGAAVSLDGVLSARMTEDGRCATFREWWHSTEERPRLSPSERGE